MVLRVHDYVAGIKELHVAVDIFAKQRMDSTVGWSNITISSLFETFFLTGPYRGGNFKR
jgi:hypothetical protein